MKIAIIGADVAGISVMKSLSNHVKSHGIGNTYLDGTVYEPEKMGGLAYQTKSNACLLNLPAGIMSIDSSNSSCFLQWLNKNNIPTHSIPRYIFGNYLKEQYNKLINESNPWIRFNSKEQAVKKISKIGKLFKVYTFNNFDIVDKVVLFAGHSEPTSLIEQTENSNYINNPWKYDFTKIDKHNSIAIVGTRLTAFDVVKKLFYNGHKGPITLFSRTNNPPHVRSLVSSPIPLKYLRWDVIESLKDNHGHVPLEKVIELLSHELSNSGDSFLLSSEKVTCPSTFIASQLDLAKSASPDQEILSALYRSKLIDLIWMRLSSKDKSYFYENFHSKWMCLAHPITFENGVFLNDAIESGYVQIEKGLKEIKEDYVYGFRLITQKSLDFDYVANCTGMSKSIKKHKSSLLCSIDTDDNLLENHFGGIDINPYNLQVISKNGEETTGFYANGAITCGVFFSAFATIHAVRNSFSIANNILSDLNIEQRASA
ncbi:hypothetical protein CS022_01175 [Veronia nyctiphanis]|uniref:FAD-dependent urate hydroxylase HpyO/Asp monooxygenase CreE-like FAD/NAD(P)-binding domain-containing protein n=1 Tax=Veronia nyctiphanis TaxID=1278244 RepID=A0A4Q0YUB6_9GAMM|nr:FAD/NAD(P)-binding protein [Veronia nyctiphanis]RXJ74850.1 hypothetical protein CS022_01175 [Veronia nyctiphanis]